MSEKTNSTLVIDSVVPVVLSESDLDEDLDLTDTKLLSSDDEQLKEYIQINPVSASLVPEESPILLPDDDSEPLTAKDFPILLPDDDSEPLTPKDFHLLLPDDDSEPLTPKDFPVLLPHDDSASLVQKDCPILLPDEEETEKELNYLEVHTDDLPDYESPAEEENVDVKSQFDIPSKMDTSNLVDDALLAKDTGERIDDDDSDDEKFHGFATRKSKVEKFNVARIDPYSTKNRNKFAKGKGKQPISGRCRYKSTKKNITLTEETSTNQEMIVTDSDRPVHLADGFVEVNSPVKEEENPLVPAAPMLCESCSIEEGHNSMVQCCDGHILCTRCVEASAKKILVGEKKGSVECPQSECNSAVPMSELRKALPAIVLDLLEDKWNKETLEALENMKDVIKCPGCSISAVLDMNLKRFQCSQCNEAYCRYCEYKWKDRKTHDLCIPTKQWTSTVTGNLVNIPAWWSDVTQSSTDYKTESHTLVKLETNSEEFLEAVHLMNRHMHVMVRKIYRVQNERLWEKYSLTRSHMVADLDELNVNEKRLFHGTHRDVIEAICKEGFDWRLCGKHGTVYGQGTYFAKSPVISHRYSSGFSSRRGRNSSIGGLFFGRPGSQPNSYAPAPRFGATVTTSQNTGFTFLGAPLNPTQSSGFYFGVPAARTTAPNSGTGFTFGGSSSNPNPVFRFGSASSSSGSNTSIGFFGAAPAKHCMSVNKGNSSGNNNGNNNHSLPATVGPHIDNSSFSGVSSTIIDDSSSAGKRKCSNCIFCSHKKKKPDAADAGKKQSNQTASEPSIPNLYSTSQYCGSAGQLLLFSSSGSASSGRGNGGNTGDQTATMQKQKTEKKKVKSGKQQNTGAHLFVRSIPPIDVFGFSSGGNSSSSGSSVPFGAGNSGSNAGGGNSGNSGNSSGNFGILDDDTGNGSEDDCFMFLARVLVGRSCIGTSGMRRPERNRLGQETHSAVDKEHDPTIFVIFDNNQCYPEYIIQYATSS